MIINIPRPVEVDDNIADYIVQLNNLGYKTRYCCEGHDPGYNMYVMFDKWGLTAEKKKMLISAFVIMEGKYKSCRYAVTEPTIRYKYKIKDEMHSFMKEFISYLK